MITNTFKGLELSRLGFGTMRLPLIEGTDNIDEEQVCQMVDYALAHGINYFDTAYPYHNSKSETVIGKALARHPRESFYLATKYPGHQISSSYDPAEIFEDQLKKCGVEYFDFYLLHNIYENSIKTYTDEKWGILDYFIEQKKLGKIKHLGFSTHGSIDVIKHWLEYSKGEMEFCQIQLNYLDWSLQDAKSKYEMLTENGIAVWVMEPLRGGKLAKLPDEQHAKLEAIDEHKSDVALAFDFIKDLPNVKMILSGMSDMQQMIDNVEIFENHTPLSDNEKEALFNVADSMANMIPCTACRYCCDGCPQGLDIPMLVSIYNEIKFAVAFNATMRIEALEPDKQPSACVACGKCTQICPQGIDVPQIMAELTKVMESAPKWADISKEREEAAKRAKK